MTNRKRSSKDKDMFKGFTLIVVPNLANKVAAFRKGLYKSNGALLKYNLNRLDENLKNFIICEDSGGTIDKFKLAKSFGIKGFTANQKLVLQFPILRKEWATDSLQLDKVQSPDKYHYNVEDVSVDESIGVPFKVDDLKRPAADAEATPAATPPRKRRRLEDSDDESDPLNDGIVEEEHQSSKQNLSSKRQLALLNSEQASVAANPNQLVIEYFGKMAEEYKKSGESFKYVNYRKAINTINGLDHKLTSYEEAIKLPNIGKKLALKIEQINKTGQLRQLDEMKNDPKVQVMRLFTSIYGVGQVIAQQWYEQGLRTIEDVLKLPNLTDNQKLGIEYVKDWNIKIPRDEVAEHVKLITETLAEIDPKAEIMCTGSYRRGAKECGDIDFLLFKKGCDDTKILGSLLFDLVRNLQAKKYAKCSLVHLSPKMRKFYGGGQLAGYELCRRVDILTVPWQRRGSTLIYFTGNDILNRSIRQLAADKDLHLSDKGLFENYNTPNQRLVESFDERKIFQKLGVTYREPKDRNLGSFEELHWF